MPIVLTNNTNTIEFSLANNYSYTVTKGTFDVELHSTDGIIFFVWIIFKNTKGVNREPNIELDWREVTDPAVTSAEDLLNTLLTWNVSPIHAISLVSGDAEPLSSIPVGFGGTSALQVFDYESLDAIGDVEGAVQDLGISISNFDLMASGASEKIVGIGNGLRNFNSYFESTYEWYIAGKGKNLATSTTKVGKSTYSITWDYDNGVGAISEYSIAWRNAYLPNLNELSPHNTFFASIYITSLSNVANAVVRMGNYNLLNNFHQWTFHVSKLKVGWNVLACPLDNPSSQTGASPSYSEYWLGVGIEVADTTVACAGIYTCNWYIKQVLETTAINNNDVVKNNENLISFITDNQSNKSAAVTPIRELKVINPVRLVGAVFDGTTKDTNFWTEAVTGSGALTQAGQITLATGTTANSTAKYVSTRKARFTASSANQFRAIARFTTAGITDNVRRLGPYDANDGYYFQLNGTTFSIGSRIGAADTLVSSGSFNGCSKTYTIDTNVHRFNIDYTNLSAQFYIDDVLIHTLSSKTDPLVGTLVYPITIENNNSNGCDDAVVFSARALNIVRLGNLITQPTSKYQSGLVAALILKYDAGNLHGMVVSGVANNAVATLYDNTAASGTIIWSSGSMAANTTPFNIDFRGLPFSIGLTLAITIAACNVTVIYE